MRLPKFFKQIITTLVFYSSIFAQEDKQLSKPNVNDFHNYIAINNCFLNVFNSTTGSYLRGSSGNGLLWPGGEQATKMLVSADGLIWGGMVDTQLIVNGSTYLGRLNPGKILANGERDDSSLSKYRIYKIRKDWKELPDGSEKEALERDYYKWPVEDGAPWIDIDKDGKYTFGTDKPEFLGDEMLWYVSNDLIDSSFSFTGSKPAGLEIQTTIFAFNRIDSFSDIIFKKYKIINKGAYHLKDLYFGYWNDVDVGDAMDDYSGCDITLSLGYTYNADDNDRIYFAEPPCLGYQLLKAGNRRKPMSSFSPFISNSMEYTEPGSIEGYYNSLRGYFPNGKVFWNPLINELTKSPLSGDPLLKSGWYEGDGWPGGKPSPGERRTMLSSGPFELSPNDTIEIVLAIIIGQRPASQYASSNLLSIYDLKEKAEVAKKMFEKNFNWLIPPPSPAIHYLPLNNAVKLWWENNAESYDDTDPFLDSKYYSDTTYTFEGYRLWQFSDSSRTDSILLATFDLKNDVSTILDFGYYNGVLTHLPVIVGTNSGLERKITITSDAFSNYESLNNYSPYYFGVTAYAYNENSNPSYLESPAKVIKVIPGQERIDVTYPYTDEDAVIAQQVIGNTDARVKFNIVDPTALKKDDTYQVMITDTSDVLSFSLYNKTTGDTLLKDQTDFTPSLSDKPVIDGFILTVENLGKDSIAAVGTKYRVKSVLEIKGKDGKVFSEPIDVMKNLNSTNKWQILAKGTYKRLNFQTYLSEEGLGYDDYELRFTGKSKYYYTGYARSFYPLLRADNLAENLLPFEVWCTGRNSTIADDDYRLAIKILDKDRYDTTTTVPDSMWTQLENNDWEEIFAFKSSFDPADPPATSGNSKYIDFKFGCLSISGEIPDEETVIRIISYKPLAEGDVFETILKSGNLNDKEAAKVNIDKISVFPNPYFGGNDINNEAQNFIRFTSLPRNVTIRIYNLAGVFIKKLIKDDFASYLDWNLQNEDGKRVGSGMYIAHIDMPEIGSKVLKIAIVQGKKFLEGL